MDTDTESSFSEKIFSDQLFDERTQRLMIAGALMVGSSPTEIHRCFSVSRVTVYRIKNQIMSFGLKGLDRQERNDKGLSKKLSTKKSRKLIHDAKLKKNLGVGVRKHALKIGVKPAVVQRIFKNAKLSSYKLSKTFLLRKQHPNQRIAYAAAALKRKQFDRILFTDEVPGYLNKNINVQNLRMRASHRQDVPRVFRTKTGVSCHAVGFISARGCSPLMVVDAKQRMNAEWYCSKVLPFYRKEARKIFGTEVFYLLEDKAPAHSSKLAEKTRAKLCLKPYLAPKDRPFHIAHYPGSSADMNPVENCWSILKDEVQKRVLLENVMSRQHLVKIMICEWNKIRKSKLYLPHALSFQRRMTAVIAENGAQTKY